MDLTANFYATHLVRPQHIFEYHKKRYLLVAYCTRKTVKVKKTHSLPLVKATRGCVIIKRWAAHFSQPLVCIIVFQLCLPHFHSKKFLSRQVICKDFIVVLFFLFLWQNVMVMVLDWNCAQTAIAHFEFKPLETGINFTSNDHQLWSSQIQISAEMLLAHS